MFQAEETASKKKAYVERIHGSFKELRDGQNGQSTVPKREDSTR